MNIVEYKFMYKINIKGKSPEAEKDKCSGSPEVEETPPTDGADGAQSEEIKQRLFGPGGATDSATISADR